MTLQTDTLRINALHHPLGIDTAQPEFAWKLQSDTPDVIQGAYQIQVANDEQFSHFMWDSGQVHSDLPFGVQYAGTPLHSSQRYFWRVRVWDATGTPGPWSAPAWFETAKLHAAELTADWITGYSSTKTALDALYLRGTLSLPAEAVHARAYVSALGWYRLFVNGADCTGNALVPRFTPFDDVVEYQTYDITGTLNRGENIVALAVGDGRFRGNLGISHARGIYGDRLAGFVHIEVTLRSGERLVWGTDERWHAGPGRLRRADPMDGELADLRLPDDGWMRLPLPPARFEPAELLPPHSRRLIAEGVPRVQEIARLDPVNIWRSPSGKQLVDFGQNFAGVVQIRLRGPAGTHVKLTHSEVLTLDGELNTRYLLPNANLRWTQTDEIILNGEDTTYQPWFTIHGFRYVEVDGLPGTLSAGDIQGVVYSSALTETGHFECSDSQLNQLHRNVQWSLRSNFMDTPTDCPTRERAGWTGDINIFGPTAANLVDVQSFLRRYLHNLTLEQHPDGTVPAFIPSHTSRHRKRFDILERMRTSVGWGDVTVMLPWTMYTYYGDRQILVQQYDSMKAWVSFMERAARQHRGLRPYRRLGRLEPFILNSGVHWGEWLRPGEDIVITSVMNYLVRDTPITTAYYAHSARLLSQIAALLGRSEDAQHYAAVSEQVRAAWRAAFVRKDGRLARDRQDDYVRALAFDLLTPDQQPAATRRLVELIEQNGTHLATGFLSTPMLLSTLAAHGRDDVAFRLLRQRTSPSWLAPIERGATTTWETWEGHDKRGNPTASHNHYAFGTVVSWLYEAVAGLSPLAPGYRRLRVAPLVGGGLTHAAGEVNTPFGRARSAWTRQGQRVTLDVTVPAGTTALVEYGASRREVGSGQHTFTWDVA